MAFYNLLGEREALTQNSENYKSAIIGYLKTRSYILVKDSSVDASLSDLIFRRPNIDKERETVIEAKFADLSLYEKDFLGELGRYFIAFIKCPADKRFLFQLFIRKLKGISNWKNVFEKLIDEDVEKLFNKIRETLNEGDRKEFEKYEYDDFLLFIQNSDVSQADYQSLIMKKDELEKSKKFDISADYLIEKSETIRESEDILSNFLKIIKMPAKLWVADLKKIKEIKEFWKENYKKIAWLHRGKIYSLNELSDSNILKYIKKGSTIEIPFEELKEDEESKQKIILQLIKKFLISKGRKRGCRYDPRLNCLFFGHGHKLVPIRKVKDRIVSKQYRKKDGSINFVLHQGIRIMIKCFNDEYYIVLKPIRLFTQEGKTIIRGKSAQTLHYKFPAKYDFNNTERSKFNFWCKLLSLNTRSLFGEDYFFTSPPIKLTIPVKPKEFMKYDGIQENSANLLEYIDGGGT